MSSYPSLSPKETAVQIRRLLRATFPAAKFSVTTSRGSMVSSVDVRWVDGPTVSRVDEVVGCFQAGHFDGMDDSYKYDRDHVLEIDGTLYRPGCKYVHTHRSITAALVNRCIAQVAKYWGDVAIVPVAVDTSSAHYTSWKLSPDIGNRNVRPDVSQDWYQAIHRAAGDRTEFMWEQDPTAGLEG